MLDFMDEVVNTVEEFGEAAVEQAANLLVGLAKAVIVITAPVWILPYILLRDRNGGVCEQPDCKNCPFPPCKKGAKDNE